MSTGATTRQVLVHPPRAEVADVPRASLAQGEVRIEVAYAGICGSELHHVFAQGRHGVLAPGAFGHEYSGIVRETGAGVTGVAVGQRVTCVPRLPCMRCADCRDGLLTMCRHQQRTARGAWAQEVVADERLAFALPDELGLREAALCEPLSCALRGIERAQAPAGHVALVIGGGPIGLLTAVLARHAGAREVLLSEPRPARRLLAERLGATAIDPVGGGLADAVAHATAGRGAAVVYEAVGLPACIAEAVELAAPGGTIVVLGVAAPGDVAPISPYRLFEHELTLVGAWGHETTFPRALAWLPRLELGALITHELPLEQVEDALAIAAAGDCGKVMLLPNR